MVPDASAAAWRPKIAAVVVVVALGVVAAAVVTVLERDHGAPPSAVQSAAVKPGPATTGVPPGTVLSPVQGPVLLGTDGEVFEGKDVTGIIVVDAERVTIRRSRLTGTSADDYAVMVKSGSVTIEDSEVSGYQNGIGFDNWVARRLDIHGLTDDAVKLGSHVRLEDSWIHDLVVTGDAHADGAQMQGGSVDVIVRHNVIDMTASGGGMGNAAIFLAPDLGPSSAGPVTVVDNWLNGGNYILYCVDGANGQYKVGGISLLDNRFGRQSRYGPATVNVPVTQRGNVFEDTGEALPL